MKSENTISTPSAEKRKPLKTPALPVSRKFYDGIMKQIEDSFQSDPMSDTLSRRAKTCVDTYLERRVVPPDVIDSRVRLVFFLLRPELDKAMKRSAAARSRRKEKSVSEDVEVGQAADVSVMRSIAERLDRYRENERNVLYAANAALIREYNSILALMDSVQIISGQGKLAALHKPDGYAPDMSG